MPTTSDSLLDRLRQSQRDGPAWERFVKLYAGLLHGWVCAMGLQPNDASDVVQEVFLVLFRKLPEYQSTPGTRFRGWLWGITRNLVRSFHRQRNPAPLGDIEPLDWDSRSKEDLAEELAWLTKRAAELLQDEFQPATWQAFWETAVAGRSGSAVAQELGMTVGAVYAARFRVQQRIREELGGLLD